MYREISIFGYSMFSTIWIIVRSNDIIFFFFPTVRYKKFEEELDSYAKQVDDIQYWGDLAEVFRYQKRTENLENKLIASMEKIDKFNEEEAAFNWKITQYPQRKQIADRLKPFKQLFDAICNFLTKHDKWMNSMIGSFDFEEIENDVALAYRSIRAQCYLSLQSSRCTLLFLSVEPADVLRDRDHYFNLPDTQLLV